MKLLTGMLEELIEHLEEATKENCKVSLEAKKGNIHVSCEGSGLALLLALATLEKNILSKTGTPTEVYEVVKSFVGVEEK